MRQSSWFESPRPFAYYHIYNNNNSLASLFPIPSLSPLPSSYVSQEKIFLKEPINTHIQQMIIFESEELISIENSNSGSSVNESSSILLQNKKKEKKSRNRLRGLKTITQRLLIMIQELKIVRYDQVATRLLLYLTEQEFKGEIKEEQNIKKRVFDALSSLIALGVIKKKGRKIEIEQDKRVRMASQCQFQEINSLRKEIAKKQQILASKKRKLGKINEKRTAIKAMLQRNHKNNENHQANIRFPFIGIMHENSEIKIEQSSKDEAWIFYSEPIQLFGDIDSLRWLKKDSISQCFNETTKSLRCK